MTDQIYPTLQNEAPVRPPAPMVQTQTNVQAELEKASRFEHNGMWEQALAIYIDLVDYGRKNPNSMEQARLVSILTRAEHIKLKIEPSHMLLNVPLGHVTLIENGFACHVALAVLQKKNSGLVLLNTSNRKEIYLKNCHVMKQSNKFAVHDSLTNKIYTLDFNLQSLEPGFFENIENILANCAIEFKDETPAMGGATTGTAPAATTAPSTTTATTSTFVPSATHERNSSVTSTATIPTAPPEEILDASPKTTADKIAKGILSGTKFLNRNLTVLSKKTEEKIVDYSANYVATTQPNEKPTEISESTKKTLAAGRTGMHYTRVGVGWVADKIGSGVSYMASEVANHVEKNYMKKDPNKPPGTESNMDRVVKVGGASLAAVGQIWNALEDNLTNVARTTRVEGVKMVDKKYGEEAAKVTDDAARIAIDGTKTFFYIDDIGMKAIAKKTAKEAGKKVVEHQRELRSKPRQPEIQNFN